MILILVVGYGGLAIWEGRLFPEVLENFELPDFSEDDEPTGQEEPVAPKEDKSPSGDKSAEKVNYDDFDLYFTKAFDFAWPTYSASEAIIERPYYTIRYNEAHEQAMWVAYLLSADSLRQDKLPRTDDFRKDPRVRTGSAELKDYAGSGYDRGHLAPAADFSYDDFALSQSFYLSNMSPQAPSFNRGIWKKLEDKVRNWAMANDNIYVVTGPVLNKTFKTIGANEVSIPEYYYKIVLDIQKPDIKAIAFLMKNEKSGASLQSFVVTIDRIESLTGLDFFPSMPDDLENSLEGSKVTNSWF
ncbi:MAG: DNA/RNA non-specific endonuclease [Roseivirga sp.]|nr:DNA/RNA non-specific endonuclease [Roseivirga sp.]